MAGAGDKWRVETSLPFGTISTVPIPSFRWFGVTWFEAEAYANWLNTRSDKLRLGVTMPQGYSVQLATEEEWERAARRRWARVSVGEYIRCNSLQHREGAWTEDTTAVSTYPTGISPIGAWDMGGNVWEWTCSYEAKNSPSARVAWRFLVLYSGTRPLRGQSLARPSPLQRQFRYSGCCVPAVFWFLIFRLRLRTGFLASVECWFAGVLGGRGLPPAGGREGKGARPPSQGVETPGGRTRQRIGTDKRIMFAGNLRPPADRLRATPARRTSCHQHSRTATRCSSASPRTRSPGGRCPTWPKTSQLCPTVLAHPERCAYPMENIKTIMGPAATREGILAGLVWLEERLRADTGGDATATGNATAVIYYTGHGWRAMAASSLLVRSASSRAAFCGRLTSTRVVRAPSARAATEPHKMTAVSASLPAAARCAGGVGVEKPVQALEGSAAEAYGQWERCRR